MMVSPVYREPQGLRPKPSRPHVWHLRTGHPHILEPICPWWDHLGEGSHAHSPSSAERAENGMRKLRGQNEGREIAKPP